MRTKTPVEGELYAQAINLCVRLKYVLVRLTISEVLNRSCADLKSISLLLTANAARILQVSEKTASVALSTATNTLTGSALASFVAGAVGAFGTPRNAPLVEFTCAASRSICLILLIYGGSLWTVLPASMLC